MAFTYSLADLGDTTDSGHALAVVRRRLGDTKEKSRIFEDEEIAYQLARNAVSGDVEGTVGRALVSLIHDIQAYIQREPDMSADWLSINWRRSSEYWRVLETDIRREYGIEPSMSSDGFQVGRDDLTEGEDYHYYNFGNRQNLGNTRVVGRAQ